MSCVSDAYIADISWQTEYVYLEISYHLPVTAIAVHFSAQRYIAVCTRATITHKYIICMKLSDFFSLLVCPHSFLFLELRPVTIK